MKISSSVLVGVRPTKDIDDHRAITRLEESEYIYDGIRH